MIVYEMTDKGLVKSYVSEDGKRFSSEEECKAHKQNGWFMMLNYRGEEVSDLREASAVLIGGEYGKTKFMNYTADQCTYQEEILLQEIKNYNELVAVWNDEEWSIHDIHSFMDTTAVMYDKIFVTLGEKLGEGWIS